MSTNHGTTDRLVDDLKTVARDAEDLLGEIKDDASDTALAARARLQSALENARETCERLQAKAREGLQTADQTIRQHPYQSIGIAAGVGLLVGFLLARK